jgi:hypothetical protein
MSDVKCNKCGTTDVFLMFVKQKDGQSKWNTFNNTPGGKFKSYSMQVKEGKKVGTFVLSKDQNSSEDYYEPHYKTCGSEQRPGYSGASKPKTQMTLGESEEISITIGGVTLTGTLKKEAF